MLPPLNMNRVWTVKTCFKVTIIKKDYKFLSRVTIEGNIFTNGVATSENIIFYYHKWNKI